MVSNVISHAAVRPDWLCLPKTGHQRTMVCALSILILTVSCRGRCYYIESDCLHITQHKWDPLTILERTKHSMPIGNQLGIHTQRALVAGTKYEFSLGCLAGSFPGQSAECGVCASKPGSRSLPGSQWPGLHWDSTEKHRVGKEGQGRHSHHWACLL